MKLDCGQHGKNKSADHLLKTTKISTCAGSSKIKIWWMLRQVKRQQTPLPRLAGTHTSLCHQREPEDSSHQPVMVISRRV